MGNSSRRKQKHSLLVLLLGVYFWLILVHCVWFSFSFSVGLNICTVRLLSFEDRGHQGHLFKETKVDDSDQWSYPKKKKVTCHYSLTMISWSNRVIKLEIHHLVYQVYEHGHLLKYGIYEGLRLPGNLKGINRNKKITNYRDIYKTRSRWGEVEGKPQDKMATCTWVL